MIICTIVFDVCVKRKLCNSVVRKPAEHLLRRSARPKSISIDGRVGSGEV